jgi:tetratricopeptide (TPR) repeat protein
LELWQEEESMKTILAVVIVLSLLASVSCGSRSQIDDVVKNFFAEVNRSNFETARVKYLYSADSPLTLGRAHKTIEDSFKNLAGYIQSVEVRNERVTGEQATLTAVLITPWGARASGRVQLIKEGGREWKISSWDAFNFLGHEHSRRAMNYCNAQNIGTALTEFQAALTENPQDAVILDSMGICYEKIGNFGAAEQKFTEAIKLYPDVLYTAYWHLGNLYAQQGKLIEAERAYEKAVKNNPDDADSHNALAWFYADHGIKLDRAIELAQKALSLSPESAYILDTLGWAYYKKGDRTQALQYLARAAGKEPNNQTIQGHYKQALGTAPGGGDP